MFSGEDSAAFVIPPKKMWTYGLWFFAGATAVPDQTLGSLKESDLRRSPHSQRNRERERGTGRRASHECAILTLTLWALHEKNEVKNRRSHLPLDRAVLPPADLTAY